ncbi:MAG: PQQ-binding-like beta-propeller repeat protein [Planctomycetaceae bacterium]
MCLVTVVCVEARAGDWPQILGPTRNGVATGEKLVDKWPKSGPKVLWRRKVGDGFSGVAVSNGIAVLFHRVGAKEVVEGLNALTGKPLWKAEHPTTFRSPYSPDKGPRCTPVIHKQHVYVFGAQGVLRCLNLKDGKSIWMRKTHAEFEAPEGYFGAGSTPIVAGGNLLVNVGSREDAGIVAFDLKTGQTAWKSTREYGSYSSPVAATIDGVKHVFFVTRMKLVSLDPDTGKVRFSFPFGKRGPTVNASSPVVLGGHLFVTAHYGVGARYVKIGKTSAKIVWSSDAIMSSQYTTPLPHKGHLIGIHGQERVEAGELRCFDPRTKQVRWTKPDFGYGTMIEADGKLLFLSTTGQLVLLKADARKYRELARASVFDTTTRALPALSNGRLYVRDTRTLKCLHVGVSR